jgi:type IV pilus assembly protein PilP
MRSSEKSGLYLTVFLAIALMTSACTKQKEDLNVYVENVKAKKKSDIPPIPVMKPYESFDYSATDFRDPFTPSVIDEPQTAADPIEDNGIRPDEN